MEIWRREKRRKKRELREERAIAECRRAAVAVSFALWDATYSTLVSTNDQKVHLFTGANGSEERLDGATADVS